MMSFVGSNIPRVATVASIRIQRMTISEIKSSARQLDRHFRKKFSFARRDKVRSDNGLRRNPTIDFPVNGTAVGRFPLPKKQERTIDSLKLLH